MRACVCIYIWILRMQCIVVATIIRVRSTVFIALGLCVFFRPGASLGFGCAINVVVFNDIHAAAADLMSSNKRVSATSERVCVCACVCVCVAYFRQPRTSWRGGVRCRARRRGAGRRWPHALGRRATEKSDSDICARVMLQREGGETKV